ncbi:MAG: hypothetical protein ACQER4_03825 [Bacteroidota bacterium]
MKSIMMIIVMTATMLMLSIPVYSQQNQQQMQQHQQQMQHQMNEMMQKMNGMMDRTHAMNQEMQRRMGEAQNEQMRNQYQQMHRFGEQLGMTLGNMKNAAERCELMQRDQEMMRDQEMRRDMDRMHEHLQSMTGNMEEAIQTMEQMNVRMQNRQN